MKNKWIFLFKYLITASNIPITTFSLLRQKAIIIQLLKLVHPSRGFVKL